MSEFKALLYDRSFALMDTARLELAPMEWEAEAIGGPSYATVEATGDLHGLWAALGWLGCHLRIVNGAGTPVWWGMVTGLEMSTGAARVSLTLDEVCNRLNVVYSYDNADGEVEEGETGWAQDDASVARYGRLEERISKSDVDATVAAQKRATWLAQSATPQPVVEWADRAPGLTLRAVGYWQLLRRVYYANALGKVSYEESGNVEHMLGWRLEATWAIGFNRKVAGYRIHDLKARLFDVTVGTRLDVTGTTLNNASYTVTGAPSKPDADHVTYVTNDVFFSSADEMYDNLDGFGVLTAGEMIHVSRYPTGYITNQGFWYLQNVDPHNIEVWPSTVLDEGTGLTVLFEQGHSLTVEEAVNNENPGDAIHTLTSRGVRVAQSFRIEGDTAWLAGEVMVRARRIGSPSTALAARIYSDQAGSPHTLLAEGTVAAADVRTVTDWVTFTLGNEVLLAPNTDYWLTVAGHTSPANMGLDCYAVELNDNPETQYEGGALKLQTAAGPWEARWGEPASMPFQVWGKSDTAAQIAAMALAGLPYATDAAVRTPSGVRQRFWRDGTRRAIDEIADMVETGSSAGVRLSVTVTPERVVLVGVEPAADDGTGPRFDVKTGEMAQSVGGGVWEAGALPAGRFVSLDNVESTGDILGGLRAFLVDHAAASVGSSAGSSAGEKGRARVTLRGKGRRRPWEI